MVEARAFEMTREELIKLPTIPRGLEERIVLSSETARTFARVGMLLNILSLQQAELLAREHRARRGLLEEVAVAAGLLTQEQVQQIIDAQAVEITVSAQHAATGQFLTWVDEIRRLGVVPKISRVSTQDLVTVKDARRAAPAKEEADLQTLAKVRTLILEAAGIGASDIHIRVREKYTEVLVRVKGDLFVVEKYSMESEEGDALVRSMYTGLATSKEGTFNPRQFQDGQIHGDALPGSGLSSVRIVRGPSYPEEAGCNFVVARLQYLKSNGERIALPKGVGLQLRTPKRPTGDVVLDGFNDLQKELCDRLIRLPTGIVLVTGPTGSGKTTTLFNLMMRQAQLFPHAAQMTIENPPEYPQEWAIQLTSDGEDFQARVRTALRSDPDIILLGELRAAAEAIAAVQAAMTGHFVWSTVHVNDPYMVFSRFEGWDRTRLARSELADADLISGLLAQRIVPILCDECSVPLEDKADAIPSYLGKIIRTWGETHDVHVRGENKECEKCNGTGIFKTQAVAEVVMTDEEFMEDVRREGVAKARRNYRKREGVDKSMLGNAMDLILAGCIDPNDAQRSVRLFEFAEGV
ncbi:ATPase, T2SS/T4P/T4SS family [Paraburkholderia sp. SIMBA_054]|uniref:ATPase, T2SS/T4P/T4SS family n=1 Tax=Paraburkholderia sp. SIMBA_054 TaxID=3085795 RepID=UPI00397926AA